MAESANISSRDLGATLQKRNKQLPPWCNPPGIGQASSKATTENYNYLHSLYGVRCGVGQGPRVCARIACSYGGGVFLCNDVSSFLVYQRLAQTLIQLQNNYSIAPDCGYLSSYVEDICYQCHGGPCNYYMYGGYEAGQLFDTDRYNVIVSAQNC